MTTTEAMRLALDALEYHTAQTRPIEQTNAAITALRAAIAAAPQPPAAQQGEALAELVALELERLAQDPPINGNTLAQVRVLMTAANVREFGIAGGAATKPAAAPQPVAQGEPAAEWADPRVQIVYEILANSEDEPPPGQHWEGWAARRIVDALAAAPAGVAPVKMSAVAKRKAADLGREGYIIAGYTMTKPGARTAVLIDAAVRWLTPEQQHVLMHVEGSVIGAPAGVAGEPVATLWQHCETGRTRVTMPDQVFTQDATWDIVGPLYLRAAPPARQALTDERITAMRQAGYLDADDYPDAWAYERGVRDAERAHGIKDDT